MNNIKPGSLQAILLTDIAVNSPITFTINSEESFLEVCQNFPKLSLAQLLELNESKVVLQWPSAEL